MAALTAPRNTPAALGTDRSVPLAAGVKAFAGGMAQVDANGYAVPASATAANMTIGRFEATVDNTGGADGAVSGKVRRGIFRYNNSANADLITKASIEKPCYVVDDQTVALTSNSNARPVAGTIFDVDAQGVWVEFK
ncbi:MAG: hypothetical protein KGJ57_18210 [Sphingomonadales bacterium]|nr:hypothetical protein [Sphingomonadales bacterium]MDE2171333.1 hypothetical protein [Sphingomonadales bacterium]